MHILFLSIFVMLNVNASEEDVPQLGYKSNSDFSTYSSLEANPYQLEGTWGKTELNLSHIESSNTVAKLSSQTGKIRKSSGAYLGRFAGRHLFATSYQVCPEYYYCSIKRTVSFPVLNLKVAVKQWLGSWKSIDFSLLVLDIPPSKEHLFAALQKNIDFNFKPEINTPLISLGFGTANNPQQNITISTDDHCKVFSNRIQKIYDPDDLSKKHHKVWSIVHGCDISLGDAGSLIASKKSGAIVGFSWTGKAPKAEQLQSSITLNRVIEEKNEPVLWTQLNYAVPTSKIKSRLVHELNFNPKRYEFGVRQALLDLLF